MKQWFIAEVALVFSLIISPNILAEHAGGNAPTPSSSAGARPEAPTSGTMKDKTAEVFEKNTGYGKETVKFNWDTKVPAAFEAAKDTDVSKRKEEGWGEIIGVALTVKPTDVWKTEVKKVEEQKNSACVEGGEREACDAAKRFLWGVKFVANRNDESLKTEEIQKFLKEMEPFLTAQNKKNEERNKKIDSALTGNEPAIKDLQKDPALAGLGKFAELMLKAGNKAGIETASKFLAATAKEKDGQRKTSFFNPKGELKQENLGANGTPAQRAADAQKFLETNRDKLGGWTFTNQEPNAAPTASPSPSPSASPNGQQQQAGGQQQQQAAQPNQQNVEALVRSAGCNSMGCHSGNITVSNGRILKNGAAKSFREVLGAINNVQQMAGLRGSATATQLQQWQNIQ